MNKKTVGLLLVIIAIASIMFFRRNPSNESDTAPDITANPIASATKFSPQASGGNAPAAPIPPSAKASKSLNPNLERLSRDFVEQMRADPSYQFKVPIRFYGKVLDQDETPIADADVRFEWNTVNATNGLEDANTNVKTDVEGSFSLEGQKGTPLCVTASKKGYYNMRGNPLCFEYAQPYAANFYNPDPRNPVVFHLRKKGQGAPLITSANGMRSSVKLSIPKDGTPVSLDLLHQKSADTGPLQVSQIKPSNVRFEQATQWSFQMTIPDGGFVEYNDEFPFTAPETGYQPNMQLDFQKDQTNWTSAVKKDYYVRFGNPPLYGRLHLETSFDEPDARFTYAINPDGSRNLEPQ